MAKRVRQWWRWSTHSSLRSKSKGIICNCYLFLSKRQLGGLLLYYTSNRRYCSWQLLLFLFVCFFSGVYVCRDIIFFMHTYSMKTFPKANPGGRVTLSPTLCIREELSPLTHPTWINNLRTLGKTRLTGVLLGDIEEAKSHSFKVCAVHEAACTEFLSVCGFFFLYLKEYASIFGSCFYTKFFFFRLSTSFLFVLFYLFFFLFFF